MKNKFILITLIFFIIFSFLLSSFSLANFEFDFENKHYSLPDFEHFQHFFIVQNGSVIDVWSFEDTSSVKCWWTGDSINPQNHTGSCSGSNVYWIRISGSNINYLKKNVFYSGAFGFNGKMLYSTFDVKDREGFIFFNKTEKKAFIENKEQISTGKFDKVVVNAADYTNKEIYLLTYYFSENTDNPMDSLYPRKQIQLKLGNQFFAGSRDEKAIYEVPLGHTGIDLVER